MFIVDAARGKRTSAKFITLLNSELLPQKRVFANRSYLVGWLLPVVRCIG